MRWDPIQKRAPKKSKGPTISNAKKKGPLFFTTTREQKRMIMGPNKRMTPGNGTSQGEGEIV